MKWHMNSFLARLKKKFCFLRRPNSNKRRIFHDGAFMHFISSHLHLDFGRKKRRHRRLGELKWRLTTSPTGRSAGEQTADFHTLAVINHQAPESTAGRSPFRGDSGGCECNIMLINIIATVGVIQDVICTSSPPRHKGWRPCTNSGSACA